MRRDVAAKRREASGGGGGGGVGVERNGRLRRRPKTMRIIATNINALLPRKKTPTVVEELHIVRRAPHGTKLRTDPGAAR